MKYKFICYLVLSFNLMFCQQENEEQKLIKSFISDLFNSKYDPADVADKYILIEPGEDSTTSLMEKRKSTLVSHIKGIRKKDTSTNIALLPNYDIKHLKEPKIFPYKDFKHLSKIKIHNIESIENRAYVLLDNKKENILQYFLLEKSKKKISSFSIFSKGNETEGWFFLY